MVPGSPHHLYIEYAMNAALQLYGPTACSSAEFPELAPGGPAYRWTFTDWTGHRGGCPLPSGAGPWWAVGVRSTNPSLIRGDRATQIAWVDTVPGP